MTHAQGMRYLTIITMALLLTGCALLPRQEPPPVTYTAAQVNQILDATIQAVAARGGQFDVLKDPSVRQGFRDYIIELNPVMSQVNEEFLARQFFAYRAYAPKASLETPAAKKLDELLLGKTTAEVLMLYGAPTGVSTDQGWENPTYAYLLDDKKTVIIMVFQGRIVTGVEMMTVEELQELVRQTGQPASRLGPVH